MFQVAFINLFIVKLLKTFTAMLKILPNFRDWLSHFEFYYLSRVILLFVFTYPWGSPRQFHLGEIGHTQKVASPWANSDLPIGKIASLTAPIVFLTFSLTSRRWILKSLMFLAKQEQVMSIDGLTYTSRGHACSMEKQMVARSVFSPFVA